MNLSIPAMTFSSRLLVAFMVSAIAVPIGAAAGQPGAPPKSRQTAGDGIERWKIEVQRLLRDPKGPLQALCLQHLSKECLVQAGTSVPIVTINPDLPTVYGEPGQRGTERNTQARTVDKATCQRCCANVDPPRCLADAACAPNHCPKPAGTPR